jgi:hypothetical protein
MLENSIGRPVSFDASLKLPEDFADAALGVGGYEREARADDETEKVGRLPKFHRFIDEIGQVRLSIATREDPAEVGPPRGWVLFQVFADEVNKLGKVHLIDAPLVEDPVPNLWLGNRPAERIGNFGVSGLDGEKHRCFHRGPGFGTERVGRRDPLRQVRIPPRTRQSQ